MTVIIVDESYGDLDLTDSDFGSIWSLFQADFPRRVREEEWGSLLDAQNNNVGKSVMALSSYTELKNSLNAQYKDEIELLELKAQEVNLRDDLL